MDHTDGLRVNTSTDGLRVAHAPIEQGWLTCEYMQDPHKKRRFFYSYNTSCTYFEIANQTVQC